MSVALPSNFELKYQTAAGPPAVFTLIPGVTDFDPGTRAADINDTTDFDSPDDSEESEAGIKRSSNGTIVINYDPEDEVQQDIIAKEGTKITLQATDATRKRTMDVLILGCPEPVSIGKVRKMTISIKLTGAIARADVS